MNTVKIKLKLIEEAKCPTYQTQGSSGFDFQATEESRIEPGKWALIKTGLVFEIPPGYELQIRPRSGLALNQGITVLNSPGTVDSDYRGEVMIIVVNLGDEPRSIRPGDRLAQGVIAPVMQAEFEIIPSVEY